MFSQTILKLTAFYLSIILAICIIFSVPIYQLWLSELDRNLRHPEPVLEILDNGQYSLRYKNQVTQEYEQLYLDARNRVLNRLLLVNVIIMLAGGFVSYYLAKRTLKPIEEAHEGMKRFTADASHELRTPITAMQTENEVALMDRKLTLAGAKDQLKSNMEELAKLTLLTEGLLRLARLEASDLPKEKISLNLVAEQAIENILPLAVKKNIKLKKELKSKDIIRGDSTSLVEAVVILLDNAVKYSPKSSFVKVQTAHERGSAVFKVSDSGPGIAKEEQEKVFERFYRGDASRTKLAAGGYGLGLAIAKNIVTVHGGSIAVTSRAGKGSTFAIKLPAT